MRKRLIIFLTLTLFWTGFIFYNSNNNGLLSHKRSFYIVNFIKEKYKSLKKNEAVENIIDKSNIANSNTIGEVIGNKNISKTQMLNVIVRKNAHAFEYLVLAVFSAATLSFLKLRGRELLLYPLFICLFCAVLDEFNQSFVVQRTSSVSDVLIDFAGSCIGMLIFFIIKKIMFRKKH